MDDFRHYKRKELAEQLMADLAAKNFNSGSRIPAVRKLAANYNVSPLTVSRLLNDLTLSGKLRHEAQRGYFLSENFPIVPRIGLLGSLPQPPGTLREILHDEAVRNLKDELALQHLEPELFKYQDFAGRSTVPLRLEKLNGLLVQGAYWDEKVWSKLTDFKGHIVVYDYSKNDDLMPVSRVKTDYNRALNKFFSLYPPNRNECYMTVRAKHRNAAVVSEMIKKHFALHDMPPPEELLIDYTANPEMEAYRIFSEMTRDWSKTFIFSLSGYFARGIHVALKNKSVMPDILSFDNLEARSELAGDSQGYFCAVERNLPQVYRRAVTLIQELVTNNVDEIRTVGINAELVIRKSIKNFTSMNKTGNLYDKLN